MRSFHPPSERAFKATTRLKQKTWILPTTRGGQPGGDSDSLPGSSSVPTPPVDRKDRWQIQGDRLVRIHNEPRTTRFAPWMADDDTLPIALRHLEVSRTTHPKFSGQQWPGLEMVEDAWCGHASDANVLQDPGNGSTLTWTGETHFERILPDPPRGREWCQGELVKSRKGSLRNKDVHPLQWWLMSESARLKSSQLWQAKFKQMQGALTKRTIPREPLDHMPRPDNIASNSTVPQQLLLLNSEEYDENTNTCSPYPGGPPARGAPSERMSSNISKRAVDSNNAGGIVDENNQNMAINDNNQSEALPRETDLRLVSSSPPSNNTDIKLTGSAAPDPREIKITDLLSGTRKSLAAPPFSPPICSDAELFNFDDRICLVKTMDYDNVAVLDSIGNLTYNSGKSNHVIKQPRQRKVQTKAISHDELANNPFAALDSDNDGPPDLQSESSDEETFDRRSEFDFSSDDDCEDEVVPHNSADDLNCGICAENVEYITGMMPCQMIANHHGSRITTPKFEIAGIVAYMLTAHIP